MAQAGAAQLTLLLLSTASHQRWELLGERALESNPALPSLFCRCAALPRVLGILSHVWIIPKLTQSWFKDREKREKG